MSERGNDIFTTLVSGYLKTTVRYVQAVENLAATLIAALALGQVAPVFADLPTRCPIWEPRQEARFLSWTRDANGRLLCAPALRGSAPLINDPLLVQY